MWTSVCGEDLDHAAPGNTSQTTCAGIAFEDHQGGRKRRQGWRRRWNGEPKTKTKTKSSTSSIGQHLLDNVECLESYHLSMFQIVRRATTLAKKKNHPRDSRREERCSTCDIMLDQARSAQGKSRGQSRIGLALRWSRLIEHDITRGTAFFSPRISMMVLFFGQGSRCESILHILEPLYIKLMEPNLCKQLQFVRTLSLFASQKDLNVVFSWEL